MIARLGRLLLESALRRSRRAPPEPRDAIGKLDHAIAIVEREGIPGGEAHACLPGFYSAKCLVLAAAGRNEEGLRAAYRGLGIARELAQRDAERFAPHVEALLGHVAGFAATLGRHEEAQAARQELKKKKPSEDGFLGRATT